MDLPRIIASTADYHSKLASSLCVALTELTSGNVGQIFGQANENRFISRLEQNKGVIMIVQLGSLLTKRAAYTAGKVITSSIQAFVGRRFSSDKQISPALVLNIDEAQSVLCVCGCRMPRPPPISQIILEKNGSSVRLSLLVVGWLSERPRMYGLSVNWLSGLTTNL